MSCVSVKLFFTARSREQGLHVAQWLSLLHYYIQLDMNSGSAQVEIMIAACQRSVIVRISDMVCTTSNPARGRPEIVRVVRIYGNGPGWKES